MTKEAAAVFDIQVDVVDTLKKGFDLIFKVTDEKLVKLCRNNELKRVKSALQKGANPNAWEEKGRTLIIEASAKGNLELVQLLIRFNADVNAKDDKGITALMEASRHMRTRKGKRAIDLYREYLGGEM